MSLHASHIAASKRLPKNKHEAFDLAEVRNVTIDHLFMELLKLLTIVPLLSHHIMLLSMLLMLLMCVPVQSMSHHP